MRLFKAVEKGKIPLGLLLTVKPYRTSGTTRLPAELRNTRDPRGLQFTSIQMRPGIGVHLPPNCHLHITYLSRICLGVGAHSAIRSFYDEFYEMCGLCGVYKLGQILHTRIWRI